MREQQDSVSSLLPPESLLSTEEVEMTLCNLCERSHTMGNEEQTLQPTVHGMKIIHSSSGVNSFE